MPADYLSNPLIFIVNSAISLYILILMLRVLLQAISADFRNPISSVIINATRLPLQVLKPIFPTLKRVNLAAIVLLFVLQMAIGMITAGELTVDLWALFIWALIELLDSFINIFIFTTFVSVLLSWINPNVHNPAISLMYKIADIVLKPVQRIVPPFGSLDLSPIVALFGLRVLKMLLFPPLYALM